MKSTYPNLRKQITELSAGRRKTLYRELRWAARSANKPKARSRVQFAQEVVRIPEGKHEGEFWRKRFQPFAYWLLHLMDTLGFRHFAITGCVQSGKTLCAIVIPLLWHLFERRESVIFIVPEIGMAEKKWSDEIKPVILKSRWLRKMAFGDPKRTSTPDGRGSKGGWPSNNTLRFANGTRLEFMGAGGNDARRSSSTAKVIFKTEVDRMDVAAESSREAAASHTVEDRAESFGDDAFIYEECTVTTKAGRIWKQVQAGTCTTLQSQCPHCSQYVRPMREHFVGVEDCDSSLEARESASFMCPHCAVLLSETERTKMQDNGIPVSRGQSVKIGTDGAALIEGDLPATEIFSFWWNAFDNRFWTTSRLAYKEWNALYSDEAEDEDKQAKQKRWTEPAVSSKLDVSRLTMQILISRVADRQRTVVPDGTKWMSCGADYRETQLHYVVRAWTFDGNILVGHAVDIAWIKVERDVYGAHDATIRALREFRERITSGIYRDRSGQSYSPGWTLIDGRYRENWLWEFSRECVGLGLKTIIPVLGRGMSDPNVRGSYVHPDRVDPDGPNKKVYWIGDECHLRKSSRYAGAYAEVGSELPPLYLSINTDAGKAFIRDGYEAPPETNNSLVTFKPVTADERGVIDDYRKQVRSEKETEVYVEGKGPVRKYVNTNRVLNHYFDADNYCCFGVQLCGAPLSLSRRIAPSQVPQAAGSPVKGPGGMNFLATER